MPPLGIITMKRYLFLAFFALIGCDKPPPAVSKLDDGEKLVLTELPAKGWGTLKGRVVFDGTPPERKPIDLGTNPHKDHCESPDLKDNTWIVDPASKGVANVVVWLQAPTGTYFPRQPADRKTWGTTMVVDQPRCEFEPHITVLYPEVYDPKQQKMVANDQKFVIRNNSGLIHEAELTGSPLRNPQRRDLIPARVAGSPARELIVPVKTDKQPIELRCSLHKWMVGYIRAFDHPYAAITNPDGTFELKNVPAGVAVTVQAWHEAGEVNIPAAQREITIPVDGVVDLNATVVIKK